MNASKENTRKAQEFLRAVARNLIATGNESKFVEELRFLDAFLEAAERRLPAESSFVRKAARRGK